MKHIQQLRQPYDGEESYYEVPQGTSNAIECKQGQYKNKWFITVSELENRDDIQPNLDGEYFLVTHSHPFLFTEPIPMEEHIWDKWTWYKEVVTPTIVAYIESIITNPETYDYLDYYEPFGYLNDTVYGEEATKIVEWIKNIWIVVRSLIQEIETEIDIDTIIQQLPELVT